MASRIPLRLTKTPSIWVTGAISPEGGRRVKWVQYDALCLQLEVQSLILAG
jgi:hypothetical protein